MVRKTKKEGTPFDERMIELRKEYNLANEHSLAWGFDHTGGFFLQVFDESDPLEEVLVVNADQGNALSHFSIADERLTYEKMVDILAKYSEKALQEFTTHIEKPLEDTLFGYAYDENGKYREKVLIKTNKDLFQFIDSILHDYIITDGWDLRVDLRTIKQLVTM